MAANNSLPENVILASRHSKRRGQRFDALVFSIQWFRQSSPLRVSSRIVFVLGMLLCLGFAEPAMAQYPVQGYVVDALKGVGIPAATIFDEKTIHGTAADVNGFFSVRT